MEISGIPLHPLVVHAAVVFTPLAALAALLFAAVPRWRSYLRVPFAVLAVVALGAVGAAFITGGNLRHKLLSEGVNNPWIAIHAHRAHILALIMIAFTVVALGGAVVLPGPRDPAWVIGSARTVQIVVVVVLIAVAVATIWSVILTGDAGARAVWDAGG